MKKKEDQGLLHFPTVFNLEPGGKSEVVPAVDADAPEWRKEVSKKVEEHKKMKEMQENLKGLKNLEREPLSPEVLQEERQKLDQRLAPDRREPTGAEPGRDGIDLQERERIKQFMESTGKTKAMLEDQHRQLFKDIEIIIDQQEAQAGIAALGEDMPIVLGERPPARPAPPPEPKRPPAQAPAARPAAAPPRPPLPAAKPAPARPAPAVPDPAPIPADEVLKTAMESTASGKTKAQLESQHRLLFQNAEIQLEAEPTIVQSAVPPAPEKPRPAARTFADFDLAKNPLPDPHALAPEQEPAPVAEAKAGGDFDLPLAELRSRHEKLKAAELARPVADRTILVSRFLAGLIDFVLVGILSLGFLWLVAYTTRLNYFASPMGFLLAVLFLVNHITYSYYFLFLLGQTLGMRMVGLQTQYEHESRLPPRVALLRTVFFLISVACLGLGLFWAVFDREAKCWQDILSESGVIRTS